MTGKKAGRPGKHAEWLAEGVDRPMETKLQNRCIGITIPAKAEFIDIVRLALYGIGTGMGYTYEQIEDMKLAVAEACNNAVVHAYGGGNGTIDIRIEVLDNGLRIYVKDEGRSFAVDRISDKVVSLRHRRLEDIQAGGLGIYLMRALMDEVEIRSEAGTEVILTKLLGRNEGSL